MGPVVVDGAGGATGHHGGQCENDEGRRPKPTPFDQLFRIL